MVMPYQNNFCKVSNKTMFIFKNLYRTVLLSTETGFVTTKVVCKQNLSLKAFFFFFFFFVKNERYLLFASGRMIL